ncbi:MAG: glycerophosphodiester phosphodiesterase [Candidatus Binatales bacterium]
MRDTLDTDFFAPPRPRAIAHRGDSGAVPENTIASFRAAAQLGCDCMELDVHMTRDGEVVVSHDGELKRMCGRDRTIAGLTWPELSAADAGFNFTAGDGTHPFRGRGLRVPKLHELLSTFPVQRFVIEVKQIEPSLTDAMLAIIDRTRMRRRVMVVSEHQQPLDEIRKLAPAIPTNFSGLEVAGFLQALAQRDAAYRPPGDALQVPPEYESWKLVTPEIVAAAHRMGIEVHVWTVNDIAAMREMLDLGVDGIITDYPARLMKLLSERARR